MSSLFPFSPQIHRQAWMDIGGKWHWNSRNQQFCAGIDPPPLPRSAIFIYACLLCPCSLDIYEGFIVLIAYVTHWFFFRPGSITLFVIFVPPQHSDKVLMASDWACGELNLVRNFNVQVSVWAVRGCMERMYIFMSNFLWTQIWWNLSG